MKHKIVHKNKSKAKKTWFYIAFMAIPIIMLILNYFVINFNSVILSLQEYNKILGKFNYVGLQNFKDVIHAFLHETAVKTAFSNSIKLYFIAVIVTTIIPILFSYYLYKKMMFTDFYKVVLFLPSVISNIALIIMYRFVTDAVIPDLFMKWFGMEINSLIAIPSKQFNTILFYYLWMSLGGGMLIQLGAMSSVDESVTEAAHVDGVNLLQELWHIVLPQSYRVIFIGLITGVISIFTNDMNLFAFFGENGSESNYTLGYYFNVRTLREGEQAYPFLAAWGIMATVIVAPITFLLRHLIYTLGPQED